MLRDAGDMPALQLPGPDRGVTRKRRRRVLLAIAGVVLTVAAADVGVQLALHLWDDYLEEEVCPSPAPQAAVAPPPAPVCDPPPPQNGIRVNVMAVRDDAVEIDVEGQRYELPGYPPPSSPQHGPSTLTTALVEPLRDEIAIAGICRGDSGSEFRLPSCARKFVRIYQVVDGTHAMDLKMPWGITDDERRVLAMQFDDSGGRLAVLVRAAWSDCMWEGATVELVVYSVLDGTRILRRVLEKNDKGGVRHLTFEGDEVHVVTTRPHHKDQIRVVQLPAPEYVEDCH